MVSTKENFVTDKTSEMEDLYALNQVKKAISKKKREIKDKSFLQEHPKLNDIVQSHRRRKIEMDEPVKGQKINLKVTHPKVDVNLEDQPRQEVDLDLLADKVVEKMTKSKKEKSEVIVDAEKTTNQNTQSAEKDFNDIIAKAPAQPAPIKTTIAVGGKWF
tara:strand:- start:423 stop:902 length:480 start_codon:yes stop_codon:yes gene_type:complete